MRLAAGRRPRGGCRRCRCRWTDPTRPGRRRISTCAVSVPTASIWMAVNDRAAEPALPADNDVGPVPVTIGSMGDSQRRVAGDDGARDARRADHGRDRPVRRSVDGPRADLVAGRDRRGGAVGARRGRIRRGAAQPAPTGRGRRDGRGHRGGAAGPPRAAAGSPHGGWPIVVGAQRNARADPACDGIVGILRRGGPPVRGEDAPVHHRRQPRTAHPVDDDSRVRRAVPAGRRPATSSS